MPETTPLIQIVVQANLRDGGEQRHREEWPTLWKLLDLKLADVRSREGA